MPRQLEGASAAYLRERFGGELTVETGSGSIGTAAALALDNDGERVQYTFVNLSQNTIYVGFKPDVSANKGIKLGPSGGAIEIDVEADGMLPTLNLYAVADGASSNYYFQVSKRFNRTNF